jgi:alpha-tubulin suppressor-like RCC1 family protein
MTTARAKPRAPSAEVDVRSAASAQAALRTFFRIAAAWQLSVEQQKALLGLTADSTFYKWRSGDAGPLVQDVLERLSYVFGIYKALQILLPQPGAADEWIHRPNTAPLFGGRPAIERMSAGKVADLYEVRKYLDAQRGGWA